MDWGKVLLWAVIIAVPLALIVVGTWWQFCVSRWVAGRAAKIDESQLPPEARRRLGRVWSMLGINQPPNGSDVRPPTGSAGSGT